MKKNLTGIKNDALRKAIKETVTDEVYAKLLKQLNTDIKDIVAEAISELTDDISSKKTPRSRAATTRFAANSGGKSSSGSKSSPRRVAPSGGKTSGGKTSLRKAAPSGGKTSGGKTSTRRVSRPSTSSGGKGRRYGGK